MIAIFLLAGAAFACLSLMLRANQAQKQSLLSLQAIRVGQQCQADVLAWGENPVNFLTGNLYNDLSLPDLEGVRLRVRMAVAPQAVSSPNSSLETAYGPLRRELVGTARAFSLELSYGSRAQQKFTLQGMLSAPIRPLRTPALQFIHSGGSTTPMAVNATATYDVNLQDNLSQSIPGVTFQWQLLPEFVAASSAGVGSLDESQDRLGNKVWLIHHYYAGDPAVPTVSGWVRLRALCRYGGQRIVYDSDPIFLQ